MCMTLKSKQLLPSHRLCLVSNIKCFEIVSLIFFDAVFVQEERDDLDIQLKSLKSRYTVRESVKFTNNNKLYRWHNRARLLATVGMFKEFFL